MNEKLAHKHKVDTSYNVKLAHKHKVDTPIKALYLERTWTRVNCTIYCRHVHACTVPIGALKAKITPRLLPGPLDRLSQSHFGTLH